MSRCGAEFDERERLWSCTCTVVLCTVIGEVMAMVLVPVSCHTLDHCRGKGIIVPLSWAQGQLLVLVL